MNPLWSYVLTAIGVFGLVLAGRRVWWSWYIGLAAQVLWLAYGIASRQYGFVVSAFAYGFVYARNGARWQRDR